MNLERIEIGDTVTVDFVDILDKKQIHCAEVLYVPIEPEDSWILKRGIDIIYVQLFEKMSLVWKKKKVKK